MKIMTTKEVARYLRLHVITVTKYAHTGEIPATRIGRVWRFDKARIDHWLAGQTFHESGSISEETFSNIKEKAHDLKQDSDI